MTFANGYWERGSGSAGPRADTASNHDINRLVVGRMVRVGEPPDRHASWFAPSGCCTLPSSLFQYTRAGFQCNNLSLICAVRRNCLTVADGTSDKEASGMVGSDSNPIPQSAAPPSGDRGATTRPWKGKKKKSAGPACFGCNFFIDCWSRASPGKPDASTMIKPAVSLKQLAGPCPWVTGSLWSTQGGRSDARVQQARSLRRLWRRGACTLPILLKHIQVPPGNITIMDFEPNEAALQALDRAGHDLRQGPRHAGEPGRAARPARVRRRPADRSGLEHRLLARSCSGATTTACCTSTRRWSSGIRTARPTTSTRPSGRSTGGT